MTVNFHTPPGDQDAGRGGRVDEARSKLAPALGRLRCHLAPDLDDVDLAGIERDLATALDRLDRAVCGEDYIEKREALRDESNGAYHFTAPDPERLPPEEKV